MMSDLEKAIRDEYQAYYLYRQLEKETDDRRWKEVVSHIYEDEKAHYEMFQQLYFLQNGRYVTGIEKPKPFTSIREFLFTAWEDELEAADFYKTLVLRYATPKQATPFWIAMHDEMEHAIRLQGYIHWYDERS